MILEEHVLFAECIEEFRRNSVSITSRQGKSEALILTPFKIDTQWDLGDCKIAASREIDLGFGYKTFASVVSNPPWANIETPDLFAVALSSIISFISLKLFKSTKRGLPMMFREKVDFNAFTLQQLALTYSVKIAGRGCGDSRLSQERQASLCIEVKDFIKHLNTINYKKYQVIMQSVRLIHLSLVNRGVDFGLSYLLVVAAIESIAQEAIKRTDVREENPYEEEKWKELADENPIIHDLYEAYKKKRGENQYLTKRYVGFILEYAPPIDWKKYVRHPDQDMADMLQATDPSAEHRHLFRRRLGEKYYPEDLEDSKIEEILSNSYKYRSEFVHRGKQPPYKNPSSSNWFFEESFESFPGKWDEKKSKYEKVTDEKKKSKYPPVIIEERILPKYELLLGIAKNSIISYIDKKLLAS